MGNRIKILRTEMQISQTDLADMALVHVANLGKIERGLTNPSLATLARIATALDTRLSTLVEDVLPEHLPESDRQITAADLLRARSDQRNSRSANER